MDMIAFYGHIETDDSERLSRLLGDWVETRELALKIGRLGVEFVYEDGPFYLYCSEAASGPGGENAAGEEVSEQFSVK